MVAHDEQCLVGCLFILFLTYWMNLTLNFYRFVWLNVNCIHHFSILIENFWHVEFSSWVLAKSIDIWKIIHTHLGTNFFPIAHFVFSKLYQRKQASPALRNSQFTRHIKDSRKSPVDLEYGPVLSCFYTTPEVDKK